MNIQLKKGVMEIMVLSLLRRKDHYGYELVTAISKYVEMSEGTIYPLLNRFRKDGLVETYLAESHNGPPRKYYRITAAGRTEYIDSVREWMEFTKAVQKLLAEGGNDNE
ncbi:MAG: PadR family transcriptional regulator [Dialister sp.]|nr:PadR family transcriptional regulator [Dialister sp.]